MVPSGDLRRDHRDLRAGEPGPLSCILQQIETAVLLRREGDGGGEITTLMKGVNPVPPAPHNAHEVDGSGFICSAQRS